MPDPTFAAGYVSPAEMLDRVVEVLNYISLYSEVDDIVKREDSAEFLSTEIQHKSCIIEVAPADPPMAEEAKMGGCVEYNYFLQIAIRAKQSKLRKWKDVYGSKEKGIWELFKSVNLKIGRTNMYGAVDYPEDTSISNIEQDFRSEEYVIAFDWNGRLITTEMS